MSSTGRCKRDLYDAAYCSNKQLQTSVLHYSITLQGMTLPLITALINLPVQVSPISRVIYQAPHTRCDTQLRMTNLAA
jgi:hypothetical protein